MGHCHKNFLSPDLNNGQGLEKSTYVRIILELLLLYLLLKGSN